MEKAPQWFLTEMKAFDPDLRVRWSPLVKLWQLERKIAHGLPINTTKDSFHDDYIRAREGYMLVAMIEPGKFSRSIFVTLRASDLWANGGWEAMADLIEDLEAREEELKWRAFSDDIRHASQEFYDFLAVRSGTRIFSPGFAK